MCTHDEAYISTEEKSEKLTQSTWCLPGFHSRTPQKSDGGCMMRLAGPHGVSTQKTNIRIFTTVRTLCYS